MWSLRKDPFSRADVGAQSFSNAAEAAQLARGATAFADAITCVGGIVFGDGGSLCLLPLPGECDVYQAAHQPELLVANNRD